MLAVTLFTKSDMAKRKAKNHVASVKLVLQRQETHGLCKGIWGTVAEEEDVRAIDSWKDHFQRFFEHSDAPHRLLLRTDVVLAQRSRRKRNNSV